MRGVPLHIRPKGFFWPSGIDIRLIRKGCANRPFFQIGVIEARKRVGRLPDEVIGTYDPMENEAGENLVSVDLNRLAYWLSEGAKPSRGVAHLMYLMGVFPPYPDSLMNAWKNRIREIEKEQEAGNADEQKPVDQ